MEKHRAACATAICVFAALRVFAFSAAFPFFNNVDERLQFDLVVKYSLGRIPQAFEPIAPESAELIARYGSPEFLLTPEHAKEAGFIAPFWKQPGSDETIEALAEQYRSQVNFESSQPPFYYTVAGCWMKVGRTLGVNAPRLLYFIRFLNVALIVVLVWLAYRLARCLSDEPAFVLGIPLVVAFVPQDIFYSIQNDNPSAILGAGGLILLLKWIDDQPVTLTSVALTGLLISATWLTKIVNLPFICVAVAAVVAGAVMRGRNWIASVATFLILTAIPICLWMLWCKEHFGDFTGSSGKIRSLTWTQKPFQEWWAHPIFTPAGAWTFLKELLARFWRGELVWHGQNLSSPIADFSYAVSSLILPAMALFDLRRSGDGPLKKRALVLCAAIFLASIAFLALLSIQFDFGRCLYPSRQFPYFTSGRLMIVALLPFIVLYVQGVITISRWLRLPIAAPIILGAIVLLITFDEIAISRQVFTSPYNWFHL